MNVALDNSVNWHVRRTLELAMPIIVARTSFLIMASVDTIMTGWSGTHELAYLALGISPQIMLMLIGIGFVQSVAILTAQAVGARQPKSSGEVFRAGLVQAALMGGLFATLGLAGEPLFLLTGQMPDIAAGAAAVTEQFSWGMPALLIFVACNQHLEATERPKIGMYIMIVVNVVNIPLNGIFALGWGNFVPSMGAEGAILASSLLRWLALAAVTVYIWRDVHSSGDPYKILTPNFWATALGDSIGSTGRRMLRIGLPMGLAQGVESGAFAGLVFIAGQLGTVGLATHQVAMTLTSMIYMIAIGTMAATAIRVGNAVGRGDAIGVRRAGWIGIAVGAGLSLFPAVFFLTMPQTIASAFTDNAQVLEYSRDTIRVAGLFLAVDAMMGVAIGALRGLGDVWAAFFFQAGCFWLIGLPIAWSLVLVAGIGPVGLLIGIFSGISVSLVLLLIRFHHMSRMPIHRV